MCQRGTHNNFSLSSQKLLAATLHTIIGNGWRHGDARGLDIKAFPDVSPGLWGPFDLRPLSLSYSRHYSLRHTGPLWPWRGEQQRWGGLWCWNDAEVMLRFAQCAWMPRTKAGPVHASMGLNQTLTVTYRCIVIEGPPPHRTTFFPILLLC